MGDFEDDFIEELAGQFGNETPIPTWRATIRRGKMMLTGWAPFLTTNGPMGKLFEDCERAGVAIADLTVLGDEGGALGVRYWAKGPDPEETYEVLASWAEDVGYEKLWLEDCIVVDLQRRPERLKRATVICPVCRSRWSDATPEFWLTVRNAKQFPKWCPLCGCEMPQWTVEEADGAGAAAEERAERISELRAERRAKGNGAERHATQDRRQKLNGGDD